MLGGMLVLVLIGAFGSSPSIFNDTVTYADGYCGDGWIDGWWMYGYFLCEGWWWWVPYTKGYGCGQFIISVGPVWPLDFQVYLAKDTSYPWGRPDRNDYWIARGVDCMINRRCISVCVCGAGTYYVVVVNNVSGCGYFHLDVKWDG